MSASEKVVAKYLRVAAEIPHEDFELPSKVSRILRQRTRIPMTPDGGSFSLRVITNRFEVAEVVLKGSEGSSMAMSAKVARRLFIALLKTTNGKTAVPNDSESGPPGFVVERNSSDTRTPVRLRNTSGRHLLASSNSNMDNESAGKLARALSKFADLADEATWLLRAFPDVR